MSDYLLRQVREHEQAIAQKYAQLADKYSAARSPQISSAPSARPLDPRPPLPVGAAPGPRADDRPPEGAPPPRRAPRSGAGARVTRPVTRPPVQDRASQFAALGALGWTGRDAEWIALVCLQSGVFTQYSRIGAAGANRGRPRFRSGRSAALSQWVGPRLRPAADGRLSEADRVDVHHEPLSAAVPQVSGGATADSRDQGQQRSGDHPETAAGSTLGPDLRERPRPQPRAPRHRSHRAGGRSGAEVAGARDRLGKLADPCRFVQPVATTLRIVNGNGATRSWGRRAHPPTCATMSPVRRVDDERPRLGDPPRTAHGARGGRHREHGAQPARNGNDRLRRHHRGDETRRSPTRSTGGCAHVAGALPMVGATGRGRPAQGVSSTTGVQGQHVRPGDGQP